MKKVWGRLACVVISLLSAVVFNQTSALAANSISLSPTSFTATNLNQSVPFDLLMNFSADPTLGGGVDIQYNPAVLSFVGFVFNPAFPTDPAFTRQPNLLPGGLLNSLAFGSFTGLSSGTVGTLTFTVIAPGVSDVTLLADGRPGDPSVIGGAFFSASTFLAQQVSFSNAIVGVVPEPEVWAMMVIGMGLVGWRARMLARRTRAADLPA